MSKGLLPRFVTPADVRDLKVRMDPFVRAMDVDVAGCSTLADTGKASWKAFSDAWRTYFDQEDSWLHTAAQMDQGEAYEEDLAHWQAWLKALRCGTSAPTIQPSSDPPGGNGGRELGSTLRAVAIAGAVIAVALGIREVTK